jgi:endonuclease/exonuclease/phosphatase (EEP) superfamily protein YafD
VKPKRPYVKVFASVRQVLRVEHVHLDEAIWHFGKSFNERLPESFTATIWNVWKGAGGDSFFSDYNRLAVRSDLMLVQEALLIPSMIKAFAQPEWEFVHAATYRRLDGARDGVLTASSVKQKIDPIRVICKRPEPIFKTTKASLITSYELANGEKLLVINIHSTLIRSAVGAELEIAHVLSHLPQHDGPILFAGDFNTFSYQYLDRIQSAMEHYGLSRVVIPNDPRTKLGQLDQVFIRGMRCERIQIDTNVQSSDHFPIIATFK